VVSAGFAVLPTSWRRAGRRFLDRLGVRGRAWRASARAGQTGHRAADVVKSPVDAAGGERAGARSGDEGAAENTEPRAA
jgi:hypothetical protein